MKSKSICLGILLFLLLIGTTCVARAEEPELVKDGEDEKIFKVVVNPKIKPLLIHLLYRPSIDYNNAVKTVWQVKIYLEGGKKPLQVISTGASVERPYKGARFFWVEDMNFDGYQDFGLLTAWGATGNEQYKFWLFDPKTKRFIYNDDLSGLISPSADKDKKLITSWQNMGSAARAYILELYRWNGDKLELIREVDQELVQEDTKGATFHKVVSEPKDGKLVVVSDRILTDKEEFEEYLKERQKQ